jgi:hypothetical protein
MKLETTIINKEALDLVHESKEFQPPYTSVPSSK